MLPGLGRSLGEGEGYPLQYSGLENSMDSIVYGVTKSWTQLSDFHFHLLCPKHCSMGYTCLIHLICPIGLGGGAGSMVYHLPMRELRVREVKKSS